MAEINEEHARAVAEIGDVLEAYFKYKPDPDTDRMLSIVAKFAPDIAFHMIAKSYGANVGIRHFRCDWGRWHGMSHVNRLRLIKEELGVF